MLKYPCVREVIYNLPFKQNLRFSFIFSSFRTILTPRSNDRLTIIMLLYSAQIYNFAACHYLEPMRKISHVLHGKISSGGGRPLPILF